MQQPDVDHKAQWSRWRVDLGALLWSSFLAACLATMVFFAVFDPMLLSHDDSPPAWLADRMTAYTIGFFFFWLICIVGSALTAFLIDTRPDRQDRP